MDWNDHKEIADALDEKYPDENSVLLSDEELIEMVMSLPGFVGKEIKPGDGYLSFITHAWISLQFPHYELSQDPHHNT